MGTLIHQFAIMTADPVFEPGERFPGCPPVCTAANLPSFDDMGHIAKWRERFGPDPCVIKKVWRCESCKLLHYLTKPRPPSGYSSGTSRR